jgi:hypothetical protein
MNLLCVLSVFFTNINLRPNMVNRVINEIYSKLKLPLWHNNNIKCQIDDDCPIPYACCDDPFFPIKNKYCCINYKKREYKYAYAYS